MAWLLGLATLAVGLTPILQVIGYLPIAPGSPHWLMVCAGVIFVAGGVAVIVGYGLPAGGAQLQYFVRYLLALTVTGLMTVVAGWVAFGPGERRFSGNLPFLPQRATELIGRAAFGVSTLMMLGIFILFAVFGARRPRP